VEIFPWPFFKDFHGTSPGIKASKKCFKHENLRAIKQKIKQRNNHFAILVLQGSIQITPPQWKSFGPQSLI